MAEVKTIDIGDYAGEQAIKGSGRVWINAEKHATVVAGVSSGVDVLAHVTVEGLKPGELVRFWWTVDQKKGDESKNIPGSSKPPVTVYHHPEDPKPCAQIAYKGVPAKAAAGWTSCLRLIFSTNSETAKITRSEFDGWWLT